MAQSKSSHSSTEAQFIEAYAEIRRQAHRVVKDEAPDCSVEATSLMHEAYERVVHDNEEPEDFVSCQHLLNALTVKMRFLLLDRARRRAAIKRGGNRRREHIEFDQIEVEQMEAGMLLALSDALEGLSASAPESAQLVHWHIFLGLTVAKTSEKMGISKSKADDLWKHARHWLHRRMDEF